MAGFESVYLRQVLPRYKLWEARKRQLLPIFTAVGPFLERERVVHTTIVELWDDPHLS
jgi:hypothetical protein